MVRPDFSIFKVVPLLAMFVPLFANAQEYIGYEKFEEEDVQANLTNQFQEINDEIKVLDLQIENINDVENLDYEYQKYRQIIDSYSALVNKGDAAFVAFDECNRSYYNLLKKVNEIKDKDVKEKSHKALLLSMRDFLDRMTAVESRCQAFVKERNVDSLQLEKKKADLLFNNMLAKYSASQDIADTYQDLKDLKMNIEVKKAVIDGIEIKMANRGELIFKITMLVGVLFIPFNIIKTKIKTAKELKAMKEKGFEMPQMPKKKKTEEDLPVI